MIIHERILKLTENEPQSWEFREAVLHNLVDNTTLPAIARSNQFEILLSLVEKAYK